MANTIIVSEDEKRLFLENAFLFHQNAQLILNDRRLYYAPVPFSNGMGALGEQPATLGVFVEWWQDCETDVTKDNEGNLALTYEIVGNPLTGTNRCHCVYPDGTIGKCSSKHFLTTLSSFMKIHKRCRESGAVVDAYSLKEVVEIINAKR